MSINEVSAPMTRNYDMRVLQYAPLHHWKEAELHQPDYSGVWSVFLRGDWTDHACKHTWGLSFHARTVFSSKNLEEAVAARQEWKSMIKAARVLVGVERAQL